MSIESEQDKKNYKETSKTSGLSVSYTPGSAVTVSGGKGKTNTDSTYESVTKQAGIYAGKEGYDIQVKNNTHLKGGIIDSKAPAEKNKLTTGTLTWENIDNKAEYKTSGKGISYSTGAGIPLNALGLLSNMGPTVKDKAGTTTTSAVSKGTLTITDKENQKQDITELNKDTENSLNKLKEIFDKTKVEEKQELIHMMNIVGNQIIHEAADHYGWKEGSTEKLLLHGAIGALTGTMSGGNALSGAVSGSVNEFALAYMEKTKGRDWINKHPDTVQNISAAFGGILSKMTGGSGHTGAYISQVGTKWNEYLSTEEIAEIMFDDGRAEEYLKLKGEPATEENIEKLKTDFIDIVKENKDADAIIMTANAGSIVGGEFDYIYDIRTQDGKSYISAGTSIGASTSPLGFSISVVKFVPLVQGIDLSDKKVRQDILSGVTFTGSVFAGIGVGAQIPIYSDYAGKVAIYLIGIGTPSVGGGIGNSESVDDKKAKIERDIQDNLYGLD